MNLTEEQKKGQEVFFRIISEAWENEDFKKYLLENPEEALEKFFGRKPPIDKKIRVTDQSDPEYLYINIPVKPQTEYIESDNPSDDVVKDDKSGQIMTDYTGIYDSLQKVKSK
ncbi:hypothetical protein [Chryseobacterium arthrosphaerae]|uniref:TOMM propeptide domain-containing protein n=1 Tax=Chryseobacterium arthrosphaerae TaxID=651561 RepID=A0A1B8ZHV3_9FLAO|nr:hypothetical protein [Chryseobacterium arthrosphaerae]OCA71178.1 hypothetical protein BBI00_15650 [Chryseobacterium arthrosphaerae]